MEFIDGRDLSVLINKTGIESGSLIKKIATEMLEALEYVHKKQIYHRDLKPANIMVTFKGDNVKLIDFGLALADDFDDNLKMAGTLKYAAPEQLTQGFNIDARADIYSFGLMLMEMLIGQNPNSELIKNRSNEILFVVKKCLEQKRDLRYANCRQIINELAIIEIKDLDKNQFFDTNFENKSIPVYDFNLELTNDFEKINGLQTLNQFFRFTYQKYKSGELNFLDNKYSEEPTYQQITNSGIYFDLIVENVNKSFDDAFKSYYFVEGEYVVKFDKSKFLLTNYRLFIRGNESDDFKLITLKNVALNKSNVKAIDYIYVNFFGFKIWTSDWDLICKLLDKKEWTLLDNKSLQFIDLKKDAIQNLISNENSKLNFDYYNFKYIDIFYTSINIFLERTKKIWESFEYSNFYANKILDHSLRIKEFELITNKVFSLFYPYKNEFLLLECFHRNGFFTNFRMFYFDEQTNDYKAIKLAEILEYKIGEEAYTNFEGIIVKMINGEVLNLPLNYQSLGYAKTRNWEMARIHKVIELKEWEKYLNKYNLQFLCYNKKIIL